MIGYYVHHQGRGHLRRAQAIAAHLHEPVTGLSSLPRPAAWAGPWLELAPDWDPGTIPGGAMPSALVGLDVDAGGRLHWAPLEHAGLRARMAALSGWIESARPRLLVSDVSVEVALLARLHGVPVVSFVQPGSRGDAAHVLGHEISSLLLAAWPAGAAGMVSGISEHTASRIVAVGAIADQAAVPEQSSAQFSARSSDQCPRTGDTGPRVLVLGGRGSAGIDGAGIDGLDVAGARRQTPGWTWDVLGGSTGRWVEEPMDLIRRATVVVTHAGQGALADVAAARRPAIVIPDERPHDEQRHTARHLADDGRYPALVRWHVPETGWVQLLSRAAKLDGSTWERWNDGGGARRAAQTITSAARPPGTVLTLAS